MIVTHCGSDIVGGDEAAAVARLEALAARRGVAVAVAHDGMEIVLRRAYARVDCSCERRSRFG
jgi:hypothetical protein